MISIGDSNVLPDDLAARFFNEEALRPRGPFVIPDDPPPHEGAMINYPLIVEPPDLLRIEVLDAAPGRPITGERIVRPDGTVSLDFYGDLYVQGLTLEQIKVKVIQLLRTYLEDETLGLVEPRTASVAVFPADHEFAGDLPKLPDGPNPFNLDPNDLPEATSPLTDGPLPSDPSLPDPRSPVILGQATPSTADGEPSPPEGPQHITIEAGGVRLTVEATGESPTAPRSVADRAAEPAPAEALERLVAALPIEYLAVHPADSTRVFVDIASFNSKVYYIQGDVVKPGRLVCTGHDTVLDVINYSGGFLPTTDPVNIHLYCPSRGDAPARDYAIDWEAIQRGDATANLQVFPNDRIVVGRRPIVATSEAINRVLRPVYNVKLTIEAARDTLVALSEIAKCASPRQEEAVDGWVDLLIELIDREESGSMDEERSPRRPPTPAEAADARNGRGGTLTVRGLRGEPPIAFERPASARIGSDDGAGSRSPRIRPRMPAMERITPVAGGVTVGPVG